MNPTEKVEKILKLAEIGYSRVEIEQLLAEPKPEKVEMIDVLATGKPEKTEPEPEKEPVQQPTPSVPTHEEGAKTSDSELAAKLEGIESTLKAIQAQNVRWSNMPQSVVEKPTELDIVNKILGGINHGNE